jgi:hypothetical protein
MAKKTKTAKAVKPKFKISLILGDLEYSSKGNSAAEALGNLNIDKFKIKTWGDFVLESGNKKTMTIRQTPFQVRRLLVNRTAKEIFGDKLFLGLK